MYLLAKQKPHDHARKGQKTDLIFHLGKRLQLTQKFRVSHVQVLKESKSLLQ